jgi:hypothetical protein
MNRILALATNLFPVWVLLGGALAREHFAALPCAIPATFHPVIGSVLAGLWRLRPMTLRKPGG